jgi:hypothetical protein
MTMRTAITNIPTADLSMDMRCSVRPTMRFVK